MAKTCPVCDASMNSTIRSWHFVCPGCAYEKTDLLPTINESNAHQEIDEGARETGLRDLRVSNFQTLLAKLKQARSSGGSLLDVGCAHGWFLEAAANEYSVLGLEPDKTVYDATKRRGLPARFGYFPDALMPGEVFDVIVFNDVIEHIPDITAVLASCKERLTDSGSLVINLPSSRGIFYTLSVLFARAGFSGFFERLWQKGLPSPHVHYFNADNLVTLLARSGYVPVDVGRLPVLSLKGLYTRISYTGNLGFVARALVYGLVALSLPVLRVLPSDIIYVIAAKAPLTGAAELPRVEGATVAAG